MKNLSTFIVVFAILAILIVVPVQAVLDEDTSPSIHVRGDSDTRLLQHLEKLEEQGYNVSAIRAAVDGGDLEEARTLVRQFMEEHRDELPDSSKKSDQIVQHLEKLEEQGYNVSAIRAAVEGGDLEEARALLRQFMEEHRDELPDSSKKSDQILQHLEKLEEQGYNVSAIRAAVESGDLEEARTLVRQFMEEHRDELPAPPKGGMKGNHCRSITT